MATGFDILIWPGGFDYSDWLNIYQRILSFVPEPVIVDRKYQNLKIYHKQSPFEYGRGSKDPHIALDIKFEQRISLKDVVKHLEGQLGEDMFVSTTCSYERWKWNRETVDCEPSCGWLDIDYNGPEFEIGYKYRRFGPYRIHFDNLHYFVLEEIPFDLFKVVNPDLLSKIARSSANVTFIKDLFKRIAVEIKPEHMALVIEGNPINPLYFHMVYHSMLSGYLFDASKIIQLHKHGGGYFYEGFYRYSDQPYKFSESSYHSSLRDSEHAKEIASTLDFYVTKIDENNPSIWHLSDEEILEILTTYQGIDTGIIGDSIYLAHTNFLGSYIEEPYLRLLDKVVKSIK